MGVKLLADTLTAQEVRDLADLVGHPGWRLVEQMVDDEWGAVGFGQKIAATIGVMPQDVAGMQAAVNQLQQATVTQREIHRVMQWPKRTVNEAKVKAKGEVVSMNRGGV